MKVVVFIQPVLKWAIQGLLVVLLYKIIQKSLFLFQMSDATTTDNMVQVLQLKQHILEKFERVQGSLSMMASH